LTQNFPLSAGLPQNGSSHDSLLQGRPSALSQLSSRGLLTQQSDSFASQSTTFSQSQSSFSQSDRLAGIGMSQDSYIDEDYKSSQLDYLSQSEGYQSQSQGFVTRF